MGNIFIGLLFVFFNLTFNIGAVTINLIPSFAGFILILRGLGELRGKSGFFEKAQPFSLFMGVFTGILFVADLLPFYIPGFLSAGTGVICAGVYILILYYIVIGIKDIERAEGQDFGGGGLYGAWKIQAVFYIAAQLFGMGLLIVPFLWHLRNIASFISFIAYIIFLVRFYRTKKLYEQYLTNQAADGVYSYE